MKSKETVVNHLTVDVEEFFHSTLLTERIPVGHWESFPRRAGPIVSWILESLAVAGSRSTFFVLGWTAERDPKLVREISDAGHEVAAHSWMHQRVDLLNPEEFRREVRRTKRLLEDITGKAVSGYRAPSFSIVPGCEWAFDILLEEGYRYDSSLFPIDVGPGYGYRGASVDPFWLERPTGRLGEFPLLTLSLFGKRFPAAGGAYLRLFPFSLVKAALRQFGARNASGTLYIHPWDVDPGLRTLESLPRMLRLRLHHGVHRGRRRLARLIESVPSKTILESLPDIPDSRSFSSP